MKTALANEEAISSEVVGQAHVEEMGLQLFNKADTDDRAANFSRCSIKDSLKSL